MNTDEYIQRPTVAEVSLANLSHNIDIVRQQVGKRKILSVVKANAYGHGIVAVALHLQKIGVDALGVAFLEEGVELRQAGIRLPILVMGGIFKAQICHFLDHDLQITVSSLDKLRQVEEVAKAKGKKAEIHLKIDTGMERVGVHSETAGGFIEAAVASKWCVTEGVYSHLACSDEPENPMTGVQLNRFLEALHHYQRLGVPTPTRHLANSGGILYFPETHLDMVRPGIMMYGVYPDPNAPRQFDLRPMLSLKSQVVYFKVVQPNRPISYGATWQTDHPVRVVTVPLGYGDGYSRALSSVGQVLIGGKRYPIAGRVCMDQFMANIEWDTVYNGDEVVLIGKQGDEEILIEELARHVGTIPYEILTGLNDRIPRSYFT